MRTFIALAVPPTLQAEIGDLQQEIQTYLKNFALKNSTGDGRGHASLADCIRWTSTHNLHLTLRFLGETSHEQVTVIAAALRTALSTQHAFDLRFSTGGCFPNFRQPRIAWCGLGEVPEGLRALHRVVEESVQQADFAPEAKKFTPHLTIARVQKRASKEDTRQLGQALEIFMQRDAQRFAFPSFPVTEVLYIQSVLEPTGPRYTPLALFPL